MITYTKIDIQRTQGDLLQFSLYATTEHLRLRKKSRRKQYAVRRSTSYIKNFDGCLLQGHNVGNQVSNILWTQLLAISHDHGRGRVTFYYIIVRTDNGFAEVLLRCGG